MDRKAIIKYRKDAVKYMKSEHNLSNNAIAIVLSYGITKEGVRKILLARRSNVKKKITKVS